MGFDDVSVRGNAAGGGGVLGVEQWLAVTNDGADGVTFEDEVEE